MWYFLNEGSFLFLVEDGKKSTIVVNVEPEKDKGLVSITFVEGPPRQMPIDGFEITNKLSKRFRGTLHSRSLFCEKFEEIVNELKNLSGDDEEICQDNSSHSSMTADHLEDTEPTTNTSSSVISDVLPRLPTTTDYLFEQKIIGQAVKVHVANLIEPPRERKVRDLNTKHVHYLEKSYAECQGADFVVHVGHLISGDIEKVATEGSCIIETIGGNHSRAAVKLLYQKGARDPFLTMTIYHQLTDFEAMRLGFHHNAIPGRNRKLTFVEKVHLVKRYVHTNNIYKNLQAIAGKTDELGTRESLRVHVKLAKMAPEFLDLVGEIENSWAEKKPLCPNTIRSALDLEPVAAKDVLLCLKEKGLKEYNELLSQKLAEKNGETDLAGPKKSSKSGEVKKWKKRCEELETKVTQLMRENNLLREQLGMLDPADSSSMPSQTGSKRKEADPSSMPSQTGSKRKVADPSSMPSQTGSKRKEADPSSMPSQTGSKRKEADPSSMPSQTGSKRKEADPSSMPSQTGSKRKEADPSSMPSQTGSKRKEADPSSMPNQTGSKKKEADPSSIPSQTGSKRKEADQTGSKRKQAEPSSMPSQTGSKRKQKEDNNESPKDTGVSRPGQKRKRGKENEYEVGDEVEAFWQDLNPAMEGYYPASISKIEGNGKYNVLFKDGWSRIVSGSRIISTSRR